MKNIIVLHPNLFDEITGSSEKLLVNMALILANSGIYKVQCVYGINKNVIRIPDKFIGNNNIKLLPFQYDLIQTKSPWKPVGMIPDLDNIIDTLTPTIVICLVFDGHQWPINYISKKYPLLLISPFGDFCSNGNVRKIYVSGRNNLNRLKKKGLHSAELFFNPLKLPSPKKQKKFTNNNPVVLGRLGRSDSYIFDPISIYAFYKLELEFGNKVKYIYVNPCQEALDLAKKLKLKCIYFKNWLNNSELEEFYNEIDIFAHARRDGETLGVAIAEAMFHECVVVTHKSAYYNEHIFLIHAPFGLVAELDDVNHYYVNLKKFVLNKNKLSAYGKKARNYAIKYFEWNTVSERIIKDCNELSNYINKPLPIHIQIYHKYLKVLYFINLIKIKFIEKIQKTELFNI